MKQQEIKMFCDKKDHYFSKFKFCELCAMSGGQLLTVFYCQRCHINKRSEHTSHSHSTYHLNDIKFLVPLKQIKTALQKIVQEIRQNNRKNNTPNFQQNLKQLKQSKLQFLKIMDYNQNQGFADIIMNAQIMQWLLNIKFCEVSRQDQYINFQTRMKPYLQQKFSQVGIVVTSILRKVREVDQFIIDWGLDNGLNQEVKLKMQGLQEQIKKITKEKEIFNCVIKVFSSYNKHQCYQTDDVVETLIQKYPESKVLYLCRIRLNQLLPSGNKQIRRILSKMLSIQPKFQSSDLYYYYMAMSQWQMIDSSEANQKQSKQVIFFQLKNKSYYRLVDVKKYIKCLQQAIAVRQKPAYCASLAIGYIVLENQKKYDKKDYEQDYKKALQWFKKASSLMNQRNDAIDANRFWAEIKQNQKCLKYDYILQSIETRTLQFITNICKYFKKSKKCSQLVTCCQQLISREPEKHNLKIQFIKSILYHSNTLQQFSESDYEKISKAELMIMELKRIRQNEANKLQKRLVRMKARYHFDKKKLNQASEGFKNLTKGTKLTSASDYYNYSATLFKMYTKDGCDDQNQIKQAYDIISKAVNLRPQKMKYLKLKYFICCYMSLFNEADRIYRKYLKNDQIQGIEQNEYTNLIQFVVNNKEQYQDDKFFTPTGGNK